MRSVAIGLRTTAKFWVLAIALVVAMVVTSEGQRETEAQAQTRVILSSSATVPTQVYQISLLFNQAPRTYYLWALDVTDFYGVGAFELKAKYPSWLMSVTNIQANSAWLLSTGRGGQCIGPFINPKNGQGHAVVSCTTFGPYPPRGPQGAGLIGNITIAPGSTYWSTTLDFRDSFLMNVGHTEGQTVIDPAMIPATMPNVGVLIGPCADFNGDNFVDLLNDIFGVAARFGMTSANPAWDPRYDLNGDGFIDLFTDIFGTASQFGMACPPPPP